MPRPPPSPCSVRTQAANPENSKFEALPICTQPPSIVVVTSHLRFVVDLVPDLVPALSSRRAEPSSVRSRERDDDAARRRASASSCTSTRARVPCSRRRRAPPRGTMKMDAPVVIAYSCSEKKEKFFKEIADAAETIPGLTCVPYKKLGSTQHDALIHKRTDEFVATLTGDKLAADARYSVDSMLSGGSVIAVDNPQGIHKLVDRATMARAITNGLARAPALAAFIRNLRWACVRSDEPRDGMIETLQEFDFPVIIKRRLACGTPESHVMAIAYDAETAVKAIVGFGEGVPADAGEYAHSMFVQEFISDHGGVLFKLYSVAERVVVQARSSVEQNDTPTKSDTCIQFDSQLLNKPGRNPRRRPVSGAPMPPAELSRQIAAVMRKETGLALIGVDLIFDVSRGTYSIVDINYFPGYKGVEGANRWILMHAMTKVFEHRQQRVANAVYRTPVPEWTASSIAAVKMTAASISFVSGFCGDMPFADVPSHHVIRPDARNVRQILGKGA